jgi:uncharacterized membrane protein YphA (DoxX/SURF4 family)
LEETMADRQISRAELPYWLLRLGLGGTAFVAGADKFFNKMTDWEQYLSPMAKRNLPVSGSTFMKLVGVIEMGVGALVLGTRPRLGGYIAGAWLCAIAANLVTEQDYWDIAARDVNMALGAFAMARLDAARSTRAVPAGNVPGERIEREVREVSKIA